MCLSELWSKLTRRDKVQDPCTTRPLMVWRATKLNALWAGHPVGEA
jgi:hypothetical protein